MRNKTALIVGATGLIGSHLLEDLIESPVYQKIISVGRSEPDEKHEKVQHLVVDFDKLDEWKSQLVADDIFCCLGTTMNKAGSKDKFRKVDYEYPLTLARLTAENGARSYSIVSAMGANKSSSIFYNQVKGEIEEAVEAIDFSLYNIFRPSLLLGDRNQKRTSESIGKVIFKALGFLFIGPLKKYKAIDAAKVARAMLVNTNKNLTGTHVCESDELQKY